MLTPENMTIKKEIGIDTNGIPYVTEKDLEPGLFRDSVVESLKHFDTVHEAQAYYDSVKVYTETFVRAQLKRY